MQARFPGIKATFKKAPPAISDRNRQDRSNDLPDGTGGKPPISFGT
jgi:hypothetical protein